MQCDEVKVTFYLKRSESSAEGRCPVIARLRVGNYSEASFSAKMSVPVSLWAAGRATGKSATAREINRQVNEYRAAALSIYREQSALRNGVTAEDVKCLLLGMAGGQQTLLFCFRAFNENFDKRVGVNREHRTAYSYWYALRHVSEFLHEKYKLSDISLSALDRSFIDRYDLYLRTEKGITAGTVKLLVTRLSTIIGHAITDGIIGADPFVGYKPESPERVQKYLTADDLERLMNTPLDSPKHYLVRNLFLFSCYTGIPYGDMCRLSQEDMEVAADGVVWIETSRKKTKIAYQIPLLELPLYILEKYRDAVPDGKLLPMYCNSNLNAELKIIARKCGIDRKLTWHMRRHTFATEITLSQGVPIETVSRMLGHTNITTTQIYAKVTDDKADEEMKALEKRINKRFKFAV